MLQVTPQMRILVAVDPADFRKGIDGLAGLCRQALHKDPFSGFVFVFRNRRATAIKALCYDGQGFWLCQKRLSKNRFRWWPSNGSSASTPLESHQLAVLLCGGDPSATKGAPHWRRVGPRE
jgi:transposase